MIHDGKLELSPHWAAYLVSPVTARESAPRDPGNGEGVRSLTLELRKVTGPITELSSDMIGVIPFHDEQGLPYPTYLAEYFPFLKTVMASGEVALLNPFYHLEPDAYPDRIRLTALSVGWDAAEIEGLLGACQPALDSLREWTRRVPLMGAGR